MGNCLVTKLKGVVDNDNLPLYNAVVLEIQEVENPTDATQWFNFITSASGGSIDAEIIGDGYFIKGGSYAGGTNVGKTLTGVTHMGSSPYYYFSNGNYKVILKGKYNVNVISTAKAIKSINLDEFLYSPISAYNDRGGKMIGNLDVFKNIDNLIIATTIMANDVYGDLKNLMTATRTALSIFTGSGNRGRLTGNLATDVLISKNTLVQFDVAGNPGVTGDIAIFGQFPNLTKLYCFRGCSTSGTIEGLVAAFRANGRTEGSVNTQVYDNTGSCTVTFNGQALPTFYATQVLSWTATTITCNGVTIEA